MSRLLKTLKRIVKKSGQRPRYQPAFLGNASGLVAVSERPNYVYAHLLDGTIFEVYNDVAPRVFNLPVFIGHEVGDVRLKVISLRDVYNLSIPPLINHAEMHGWAVENGGHDPIYVHPRQMMALRPKPTTGMIVDVSLGYYPTSGLGVGYFAGGSIDLTSNVPSSQARWVLVSLNTATNALAATNGSSGSPLSLTAANIPATPSGHIALAAFLLKTGQTEIVETRTSTDIVDLRSGVFLGVDMTPYLKKDGSNDPVTGGLIIQPTVDEVNLILKAKASQTANIQEWQNSAGAILAKILANGTLELTNNLDLLNTNQGKLKITGNYNRNTGSALDYFVDLGTIYYATGSIGGSATGLNLQIQSGTNTPNASPAIYAWQLGAYNQGSGTLGTLYGVRSRVGLNGGGPITNVYNLAALGDFYKAAGPASTITNYYGFIALPNAFNYATVTNLYAMRVNNHAPGTGSTLTNFWGLYIEAITGTTNTPTAIITHNGLVIINENGDPAADVRIEGDTDQNLFFTDASADMVGIGTNSPTAKMDINSDKMRLRTAKTPSSASDTGNAGDVCWDADYIYICVATNTWKRSPLSTW